MTNHQKNLLSSSIDFLHQSTYHNHKSLVSFNHFQQGVEDEDEVVTQDRTQNKISIPESVSITHHQVDTNSLTPEVLAPRQSLLMQTLNTNYHRPVHQQQGWLARKVE